MRLTASSPELLLAFTLLTAAFIAAPASSWAEDTAKPATSSTTAKKDTKKTASPFRKSQESNARETVKKPDPTPDVLAKPLVTPQPIPAVKNSGDKISGKTLLTEAAAKQTGVGESGLPVPRFVSLKSGEINARTGPGDTYPIRWVYQRKNLPVEVTAEFKLWRRIKDFDGEQSWIHQAMLSSRHYAIVSHDATAQNSYDGDSPVARIKRGVQVRVDKCKEDLCKVEYGRVTGWLKKKDLWGIYPSDIFD